MLKAVSSHSFACRVSLALALLIYLLHLLSSGKLEVSTCSNQDPLQASTGLVPIIGIDVWEHAYYVEYRNLRPDYLKAIWNVINWDAAEKRLEAAK